MNLRSEKFKFVTDFRNSLLRMVNNTVCRLITKSNCMNFIIFCTFMFIAFLSSSLLCVVDAIAQYLFVIENLNTLGFMLLEIPVNVLDTCPFFIVMFALEVTTLKSSSTVDPTHFLERIEFPEEERRNLTRFILKKSLIISGVFFLYLQLLSIYVELYGEILDDHSPTYSVYKIMKYTLLSEMSISQLYFLNIERRTQEKSGEIAKKVHKELLVKKFIKNLKVDSTSLGLIVNAVTSARSNCADCSQNDVYCKHTLKELIENRFDSDFERLKLQLENNEENSIEPLPSNPRSTSLWLKIAIILLTCTYLIMDVCSIWSLFIIILKVPSNIHDGFFGNLRYVFEIINMITIAVTVPILIREKNIFGETSLDYQLMNDGNQSANIYSSGSFLMVSLSIDSPDNTRHTILRGSH